MSATTGLVTNRSCSRVVASRQEVHASAPDFAASVRAFFDAHHHKTIATLRKDDHFVIDFWREGKGLRRTERR